MSPIVCKFTNISLCVPALPDAEQVYDGVNIPSLERLVVRCRFSEHPDIGALQAFAGNPAHAGAYALPISLGRLRRSVPLILFFRHICHFEISGRAVARRGENGTSRRLFRFIVGMPASRSLRYEGMHQACKRFRRNFRKCRYW